MLSWGKRQMKYLTAKQKKAFKNALSGQVKIFLFSFLSHISDSPGLLFCFFLPINENNGSESHFAFSFDPLSICPYQRKFSEASVGEMRLWILAFIISMTNWEDSRLQKKWMRGDVVSAFKCVKGIKALEITLCWVPYKIHCRRDLKIQKTQNFWSWVKTNSVKIQKITGGEQQRKPLCFTSWNLGKNTWINILNKGYILMTRSWIQRGVDLDISLLSSFLLHVGYFSCVWNWLSR